MKKDVGLVLVLPIEVKFQQLLVQWLCNLYSMYPINENNGDLIFMNKLDKTTRNWIAKIPPK